jgi:hypothetical protein
VVLLPAFFPRPITEKEFRVELAEEHGDPEVFEAYEVPHPPKLLVEDADAEPGEGIYSRGAFNGLISDKELEDMVNTPRHYNGGIETIDAIRHALGLHGFRAFCRGNALKYVWRAGKKHNEVEDLQKAAWYCRMAAGDDPRG